MHVYFMIILIQDFIKNNDKMLVFTKKILKNYFFLN